MHKLLGWEQCSGTAPTVYCNGNLHIGGKFNAADKFQAVKLSLLAT